MKTQPGLDPAIASNSIATASDAEIAAQSTTGQAAASLQWQDAGAASLSIASKHKKSAHNVSTEPSVSGSGYAAMHKWRRSPQVKPTELTRFFQQTASLLQAGIPLGRALEILHDSAHSKDLAQLSRSVGAEILGGHPLSDALQPALGNTEQYAVALIRVGEQCGRLEAVLTRLANDREKAKTLRRRVTKAMTQPSLVFLTAIGVTAILLAKVVPQFELMFQSFDKELPALTQLVIQASMVMRDFGLPVLGFGIMLTVVLRILQSQNSKARMASHRLLCGLPLFGPLVRDYNIARFAVTLLTAYASGVTVVEALSLARATTTNRCYANAIEALSEVITQGQSLYTSMATEPLFPPLLCQIVRIGEETGSLENMLAKASAHYTTSVDDQVDRILQFIEPGLMIFLGVFVGGLILALYMPIFQMGAVLG